MNISELWSKELIVATGLDGVTLRLIEEQTEEKLTCGYLVVGSKGSKVVYRSRPITSRLEAERKFHARITPFSTIHYW